MIFARLSLVAGLIVAGSAAQFTASAQQAESRYVKFNSDACKVLERDEESGSVIERCNNDGDFPIYLAEGDLRHFIGYGPNGLNQRAFSQTLTPFNRANNVVELRYFAGAGEPHAAILRYYTDAGMGDGSAKGEVLVVTKLDGDEACHVAYIDARANPGEANELAREAADGDEGFDCLRDEPQVIGKTGVSPM